MYRQQKMAEETSKTESDKSGDESIQDKEQSSIEAPTSSTPPKIETKLASKSPDIVSSTLSSSKESSHLDKSMEMLRQIFPGKPQKILEAKLREARGDVVKALELCAKYFDQKELKSVQQFPPHPPPTTVAPPLPLPPKVAPPSPPQENNNNPFMLNFSHVGNVDSARFPPPFSTAAMAAMLANSQHKSAFIPTTASASAPAVGNHTFYRNFEHHPNFLNKDIFPFPPPPLFPPSFFVGFGTNHLLNQSLPSNLSMTAAADPPAIHRPCVDPLCGQCAPKVDSTDDTSKDHDNTVEELKHD